MKKLLALVPLLFLLAACSDPADPADNVHAAACAGIGGAVKKHGQFGGKWSVYTYWCDHNGQITDVWWDE